MHFGLFGRAVTLFGVALAAAGNHVFPTCIAATTARVYVVERQVTRANAAILAGVVISSEDVLAVKGHALVVRAFHVLFEFDDAGNNKNLAGGAQDFVRVLEPLGNVVHQE